MTKAEERLFQLIKENKEYNEKNHIDDSYVPLQDNFMYNFCNDLEELLIKNKQLYRENKELKEENEQLKVLVIKLLNYMEYPIILGDKEKYLKEKVEQTVYKYEFLSFMRKD